MAIKSRALLLLARLSAPTLANQNTTPAEKKLRVVSAVGMRQVLSELTPEFERSSGRSLPSLTTAPPCSQND